MGTAGEIPADSTHDQQAGKPREGSDGGEYFHKAQRLRHCFLGEQIEDQAQARQEQEESEQYPLSKPTDREHSHLQRELSLGLLVGGLLWGARVAVGRPP